jgi:hypothetical protein
MVPSNVTGGGAVFSVGGGVAGLKLGGVAGEVKGTPGSTVMGPGDGPLPGIVTLGGLTVGGCAVGCTTVGGGAVDGEGKRIRGGVAWLQPEWLDSNSHAVT